MPYSIAVVGSFLSLLLTGAIAGFFYAWSVSAMWGLDTADPRHAIGAMTNYVALLRGIGPLNPNMRNKKLLEVFEKLGFKTVRTVISSGNVLFQGPTQSTAKLEAIIEKALPKQLGFHSTTIIRNENEWQRLIDLDPFKGIKESNRAKPHVTFLKNKPNATQKVLPSGKGYEIVRLSDRAICYTVDLSATKTPNIMRMLEVSFGKNITTRTWGTVLKICARFDN